MADQVTTYKCPACEGPLRFDGKTQKLKCDYCDSMYTVEEVERLVAEKTAKAEAARDKEEARLQSARAKGDEYAVNTYVCTSCGAALDTDPSTAVTICPYCGNAVSIAGQMSKALKPDFCVPFRLEKEDAVRALKEYYKGKLLLPKSFTEGNHLEKIQGVYVPFWLFSGTAHAKMRFEGRDSTTHRTGKEEIVETKVYDVKREGDVAFERIPADSSTKMPDDLMDSIEPFDYKDLKPFSMAYLPGFSASRYDVEKEDVKKRILTRAENTTASEMAATVSHSEVRELARDIRVSLKDPDYAVMPVWLLNTRWNNQDFLFAMNGQTGKMIGNLPIDGKKAAFFYILLTLGFGVIFSIIAMFI